MVNHVKFLMSLRLYGIKQQNHLQSIDGWAPLAKIGGLGPLSPPGLMPLVQYTECRNEAQTGQTRFTILCHYLGYKSPG